MLTVYGVGLFTLLLAFGCGLPFAIRLLPRTLADQTVLLAPWFGISYLIAGAAFYYRLEIPETPLHVSWLLLPPALLGLVEIRCRSRERKPLWNREAAWALIPAGIVFILICQTLLHASAPSPTCISRGNNDIADYACAADMLREHARHDIPFPGIRMMIDVNWSAPPFFMAAVAALCGHPAYEIATLVMGAVFVLGVFAFYSLARGFGFGRRPSSLLALIYGTSPLMQGIVLDDFGGQIFGIGFAITAIVLVRDLCRVRQPRFWRQAGSSLAMLWGLLLSYAIVIPLVAGFAALAGPVSLVLVGRRRRALRVGGWLLLIAAAALLLFFPRIAQAFASVRGLALQNAQGWFVPLMEPSVWLGFTFPVGLASFGIPLGWCAAGLLLAAIALFMARPSAGGWSPTILLLGYVALYLGMAYHGRHAGVWGGYESYKVATLFFPFFLIGAAGLMRVACRRLPFLRHTSAGLALLMLIGAAFAGFHYWKVIGTKLVLRQNLTGLRELDALPVFDSINIPDVTAWEELWLPEMLESKQLLFSGSTVSLNAPQGHWDLLRLADGTFAADHQLFIVSPNSSEAVIPVNRAFGLRRHRSSPLVAIRAGENWWPDEIDHRCTGPADVPSRIAIFSAVDGVHAELEFRVDPHPNEEITITPEGGAPIRLVADEALHRLPLLLQRGENDLFISSNHPPQSWSRHDRRLVGLRFTDLTVSEAAAVSPARSAASRP